MGCRFIADACIPCEEGSMYFDAGLKVENDIYLIEHLSRCLVSIHIPTGKTEIKAFLPWEFKENKIGMLLLNQDIIIYSPVIDHLLVYDCLKQQITAIKLQGIKADKAGFYFSNILIDQGDFVVLPFNGKVIKRYGIDGQLKFKDDRWCSTLDRESDCSKNLFGNIRIDSACIVEKQLFFSLVYRKQNYLCKYELDKEEKICSIVYHSNDIAIRGVYAYPNIVLFRRIFLERTEIVLMFLDSNKQKTIAVDCPSTFDEDVYGDIHHFRASFKNEVLAIQGNDLNMYQKIYKFGQQDTYVANGILFNDVRNEVLMLDVNCIRKYLIEKTACEIKKSTFYREGCRKLFDGKHICEGKYRLHSLIEALTEFQPVIIENEEFTKNRSLGELIWKMIQ